MKTQFSIKRLLSWIILIPSMSYALTLDSLFEPVFKKFSFLPDYYLRFNVSFFALHQDAFFKRQYLAEPYSDIEFKLISYKDIVSSVWDVDFLFGLGEVPGNVVFTVLNVRFGIDPKIEVKIRDINISTGLRHYCYHEVDRSYFSLIYNNLLHLEAASINYRSNEHFKILNSDSTLVFKNRFAWKVQAGFYLKRFFNIVTEEKLNGNSPLNNEFSGNARYAFYKRKSWIIAANAETVLGSFDNSYGYKVRSDSKCYWKQAFGVESFFTRGSRGGKFYLIYHLDDLPVSPNDPDFTMGNSRLSKKGLLEFGVMFFN